MPVRRLLDGWHQLGHLLELVEDDRLAAERPDEAVRVGFGRGLDGGVVQGQITQAQLGGYAADQGGLAGLPWTREVDDAELGEHVTHEWMKVSGVHRFVADGQTDPYDEKSNVLLREI